MDIVLGIPRVSPRTPARRSRLFRLYYGIDGKNPGKSDGAVRVSKLEAFDLLVGSWAIGSTSTSPST